MDGVTRIAIALGSNLGDRAAHLEFGVRRLSCFLEGMRVSRAIETAAVGTREPQPPYLNAAAVGGTSEAPRAVLERLLAIEAEAGRTRSHLNAARTLDLDLILYGSLVLDEPGLVVPHPRFRERAFVLGPLAEIAPELLDPVTGLTVAALAARVRTSAI